jgi:hypothetical protein
MNLKLVFSLVLPKFFFRISELLLPMQRKYFSLRNEGDLYFFTIMPNSEENYGEISLFHSTMMPTLFSFFAVWTNCTYACIQGGSF